MRARRSSSRGQIMVILAVALPGLLGAMALAIDVWNLYSNWTHLQIAADAGVLAGATFLHPDPTDATMISTAQSYATTYAQNNGLQPTEIVGTPEVFFDSGHCNTAAPTACIRMTVTRTVPFYFGRVLGLTTTPVSATAQASIEGAGGTNPGGLGPIGIQCTAPCTTPPSTLNPGDPLTLTLPLKGSVWAPGNWGALDLGGNGVPTLANNILNGYDGTVNKGDWVPTDPGFAKGSTVTPLVRDAINTLINEGSTGAYAGEWPTADGMSGFTPSNPRIITLPLVDFNGANGSSDVQIEGFLSVWLLPPTDNKTITGIVVSTNANSIIPGGGGTGCVSTCAPVLTM